LAGDIDRLPAQAWFEALQKLRTPAEKGDAGKSSKVPFLGANLRIKTLRFGAHAVNTVDVRAQRSNQDGWTIAIDGVGARGQATWPPGGAGHGMLRAHLSHLQMDTLQAATQNNNATRNNRPEQNPTLSDIDPALLPAVDVVIDDLRVGPTDFGTA